MVYAGDDMKAITVVLIVIGVVLSTVKLIVEVLDMKVLFVTTELHGIGLSKVTLLFILLTVAH